MLEGIELDSTEPIKIPNLQDFRYLLKHSKLFQDYFNVFLNLPVFSQKFYYDELRNMFSAACTLTGVEHQVTHPKALVWVHRYRLPLFWKSELLFEYLFTTALAMKSPGSLLSIHDYKDFRAFLLMTQGESLVHFWLDSERLKYLKDPLAQDYLISKIHRIYTDISSPCLLPNSVSDIIVTGLSHCKVDSGKGPQSKFNFDGSFIRSAAIKVFAKAQDSSLELLCHYWLAKHCVHAKRTSNDKPTGSYLGKHRTSSVFAQKITKKDNSLDAVTHDYCSFPHINSKSEEIRAGKLPTLSYRASQKTSFHGYNMFSTASELSRYNSSLTKLLRPLIAPSTHSLLDAARQVKQPSSLTGPRVAGGIKEYNIISSGLKADSIGGNPFMRYLLSKPGKASVVNYLLFLQSIEEILKEDKILRRSVLSGRDTCYPYHCYHYQPMVTDIEEFIYLFVKPNAYKGVRLPLTLQKKMMELLPRGLGKSLLNSAQIFAIKKLLPSWKEFLLDDCNLFITQCITGGPSRLQRPNKHNIIGILLSDTQVCGVMWKSFQLAESVLTPECISVNQAEEAAVTSESSTLLAKEEDLMDLETESSQPANPMITTWSTYTQCSDKSRKTYVTSVTLPAIQKQKKVEPQLPKTFSEILHDAYQLENFEKFLLAQDDNGAAPLQFWMTIEEFKTTMSDLRVRDIQAVGIQKKYFGPDADKELQCQDPIIYELMQEDDVNPYQLISAQLQVVKSMEQNWFHKYLRSIRRGGFFKLETAKQPMSSGIRHKNHVKSLWQTFFRNVHHFIRDVNNQDTLVLFRKYLAKEILNNGGNPKKVFGKRLIFLNKLLDDLGFWIEAQRFKYVADSATENKKAGAYSQEVDNILHRKAHAIINCYINSPVPPKIQINCPPDVAQFIMDRVGNEQYTRELFHEATIFVFPALFHYWKLFAKNSGDASSTNKQQFGGQESSNHRAAFIRRSSFSDDNVMDVGEDNNDLVLSFSLSGGIYWRRGRHILRYENLKDYLTFRVSYLY